MDGERRKRTDAEKYSLSAKSQFRSHVAMLASNAYRFFVKTEVTAIITVKLELLP